MLTTTTKELVIMANQKHINACISVNNNLQITFVPNNEIEQYLAEGYSPQTIMVKNPEKNKMPDLTPQEERILNLFMEGKTARDISLIVRIDDRSVNRILSQIRNKFKCDNNVHLALKVQKLIAFPVMI